MGGRGEAAVLMSVPITDCRGEAGFLMAASDAGCRGYAVFLMADPYAVCWGEEAGFSLQSEKLVVWGKRWGFL